MSDVERRCAMGGRCRSAEVKDGKRRPALLTTQAGLCEPCLRWVLRSLAEFPRDWWRLKAALGDRLKGSSDKITYTPTPTVPINVDTDALMCGLVDVAAQAAQATEAVTGIRRSGGVGRGFRSLSENAEFAEKRFAEVIAGERGFAMFSFTGWDESGTVRQKVEINGFEIARRVVDLSAKVRGQLGESEKLRREPLPCPRCDTPRALVREVQDRRRWVSQTVPDGSATPEVVRCLSCGEQWSESDYKWLSRLVLGEKEGKQMLELSQWLVAEARWERDVAAWLAAEAHWALADIAGVMGVDGAAALLAQVRRAADRVSA